MDRFAIVNLPIPKFETSLGNLGLEVIVLSRNTPYFVESVEISNQFFVGLGFTCLNVVYVT